MQAVKLALALCAVAIGCSSQREAPAEQVLREAVQGTDTSAHAGDSATTTAAPTSSIVSCGRPVMDGDGVGNVRIGMSVDTVKAYCTILRDTVELRTEGQEERILLAPFEDDTANLEVHEGRVWRIEITNPGIRTSNWLGVGTPLATLLDLKGGVQALTGEGNLFLISKALCGMSFELSEPKSPTGNWDAARLRTLPKSTVVKRVLVIGCPS